MTEQEKVREAAEELQDALKVAAALWVNTNHERYGDCSPFEIFKGALVGIIRDYATIAPHAPKEIAELLVKHEYH